MREITISTKELLTAVPALSELIALKVSAKTAWRLNRIRRVLQPELDSVNEARQALFQKYAKRDDAGEPVYDERGNGVIDPVNEKVFLAEAEDLMKAEITVAFPEIKIEDLGDVKINAATLGDAIFIFDDSDSE